MISENVRIGSLVEIVRSVVVNHTLVHTGKIGLVLGKHYSHNSYLVLVEDQSLVFNSYEFEVLSEV